jgi:hypothetical protein
VEDIMQKVETYRDMLEAKRDMNEHIRNGWRVHTCTMGCYISGYFSKEKVLVVYEK